MANSSGERTFDTGGGVYDDDDDDDDDDLINDILGPDDDDDEDDDENLGISGGDKTVSVGSDDSQHIPDHVADEKNFDVERDEDSRQARTPPQENKGRDVILPHYDDDDEDDEDDDGDILNEFLSDD